jgi:ribonuclease J
MISLSFFGGVGEIGGTKILLTDVDSKIWLDFGRSFTMGEDYYTRWLQPRSSNGLGDYFEFNLLPKISNLYSKKMLEKTDLKYGDPQFDAVFITHAHADHVSDIQFIDPLIPIYTGAGTKIFMEAMEKTSSFTNYGIHDYKTFRTGDKIQLNSIEIKPIHVDHSIPAAYGYIIYTSEGCVVYTGDLRNHGPRYDMTQEFLEAAEDSKPMVMITEGTRMADKDRRKNLSEKQVQKGVYEKCQRADKNKKTIYYTHGPRDMDRLRTFYSIAKTCNRKLIVNTKTAFLLNRLVEDKHLNLPDPHTDDIVSIYFKKKRSGKYDDKDYYTWEREFLDKLITPQDLKKNPESYIVSLNFYDFAELIDIRPEPRSFFIYSMSEHFGEENIEEKVMHNWLQHFSLQYHQLHASGHLSRQELSEAIEKINPKKLFPVHTENPNMFIEFHNQTISPILGDQYMIRND